MVAEKYIGATERVYSALKVAPLVTHLESFGISAETALAGTEIPVDALTDPGIHISRAGMRQAFVNFMALCPDHISPLELGASFKLTDYGILGYALFSSPTVKDAVHFAFDFKQLATPVVDLKLVEIGDEAMWHFDVYPDLSIDDETVRFITEYQTGMLLALHRAVTGERFTFKSAQFAYPIPAAAGVYELVLHCPVRFHAASTELRFDKAWLDEKPIGANPLTFKIVEETCRKLIHALDHERGIVGEVYRQLMADPGRFATLDVMAKQMKLSKSKLISAMKDSGLTYQQALDEVRFRISSSYLHETRMSGPLIASRLGYASVANFRTAFKRWSGHTPEELKERPHQRTAKS
jgi:AraC-like DNA-binding protein